MNFEMMSASRVRARTLQMVWYPTQLPAHAVCKRFWSDRGSMHPKGQDMQFLRPPTPILMLVLLQLPAALLSAHQRDPDGRHLLVSSASPVLYCHVQGRLARLVSDAPEGADHATSVPASALSQCCFNNACQQPYWLHITKTQMAAFARVILSRYSESHVQTHLDGSSIHPKDTRRRWPCTPGPPHHPISMLLQIIMQAAHPKNPVNEALAQSP